MKQNILLDIIFQSGDFFNQDQGWLQNFLITTLGAAIGSGATIWAVYLAFNQDKKKDEWKRIQFQKEKMKYLQSLIRNINRDLRIQIDAFKTQSDTINAAPLNLPRLSQVPFNDIERVVDKLNLEEYYHSYLNEFGDSQEYIDEFRKIVSFLDYAYGNLVMIKDSFQKTCTYDYEAKVKLKDMIEKALDDVASMLIFPEVVAQHDFFNFLNESLVTFHAQRDASDNADLKFYHDNFIHVVKTGLIPFSFTIPVAHKLIVQLKNATHFYEDIQAQNVYIADDFTHWFTDMNKHYTEYLPITNRIVNYKG
jgi:hypothetical protein